MAYAPAKNKFTDQTGVLTTSATATTIKTIPVPSPVGSSTVGAVQITTEIVGVRTGGSGGSAGDSCGFVIVATVKNVSGTATVVGAQSKLEASKDNASVDANITVSGANAIIQVTGDTNNNYTWIANTSWKTIV